MKGGKKGSHHFLIINIGTEQHQHHTAAVAGRDGLQHKHERNPETLFFVAFHNLRIYCIETSANRSQMIWRWPRQKTNIPSSFLFFSREISSTAGTC
jgi:hypothetical protein